MGPPKTGKSTLIKSLVKKYTKHSLQEVTGPVTVVTGKNRRVTFFECPSTDVNAMMDLAKIADLVLLTVDASFGFEMETFEFLNILQVHGFPRVMGVLTHLDSIRDGKKERRVKKTLKQRFWVEIHQGAKLFYLSGTINGQYLKREVHNLALYISRIKFRPLTWRSAHPYCLIDRVEDITESALVQEDSTIDRTVALFGFLRGSHLKENQRVHIAGVGDFHMNAVIPLPDPVPLPETDPEKRKMKRTLNAKETLLYAPMAQVGGIVYDKDAVYINLPKVHFTKPELLLAADRKDTDGEIVPLEPLDRDDDDDDNEYDDDDSNNSDNQDSDAEVAMGRVKGSKANLLRSSDGVALMKSLQNTRKGMDEQLSNRGLSLFHGGKSIKDKDAAKLYRRSNEDDNEEDDELSDDSDQANNIRRLHNKIRERIETDNTGRSRRRAVFENDEELDSDEDDNEDDYDEEGDSEDDSDEYSEDDTDDDEEGDLDDDENDHSFRHSNVAKWKTNLVDRAEEALQNRRKHAPNIMELVYGSTKKDDSDNDSDASSDGSELFKIRKAGQNKSTSNGSKSTRSLDSGQKVRSSSDGSSTGNSILELAFDENAEDCTLRGLESNTNTYDIWNSNNSLRKQTRNRFVTGDWGGKRLTKESRPNDGSSNDGTDDDDDTDNDDNDSEVYGDFEDLEGNNNTQMDKSSRKCLDDDDDDDGSRSGSNSSSSYDSDESDEDNDAPREREFVTSTRDYAAERQKAAEEKARMKADFDAEYDRRKHRSGDRDGNNNGKADEDQEGGETTTGNINPYRIADELLEDTPETKALKARLNVQSEINKMEFANIPEAIRNRMTGYQSGMYVRIEISGVPVEFITNFRPNLPVLLGGLLPQEEGLTLIRMRIKKHRWHPRILKANDPLIFSIGWRRFQSLPLFSTQDDNERHRYLKYTPDHMHCFATIYGPATPPNTGVVAFQTLSNSTSAFRITGTGVVLELDSSMRIMKKLKLTGVPHKIYKNTAFIRGMFNSELEIARFEGASIRTVSGVRGTVKKAVKDGPTGTFRATFEDKILMSDIVFCRTWVPVEPKRFYNPITSLLDNPVDSKARKERNAAPTGDSQGFGEAEDSDNERSNKNSINRNHGKDSNDDDDDERNNHTTITSSTTTTRNGNADGLILMRPVREIRHELGKSVVIKPDSLYTPIERPEVRQFNPFHIPRSVAASLPFASKPKQQKPKSNSGKDYFNKRAVIMSKEEREEHNLMQRVFTVAKEKESKAKAIDKANAIVYQKKKAVLEAERQDRMKGERKRKYRQEGLRELNKRGRQE